MNVSLSDVKELAQKLFNIGPNCNFKIDDANESIEIVGTCMAVNNEVINNDNMAAYRALAGLDGDARSLSARDLKALADPRSLAYVIEKDPALQVVLRKGALEFKKNEVRPDESHGRPKGIPPLAYKRLLFYFQHGLKALGFFKGEPNGVYGAMTAKAVDAFQKNYGIEGGDHGRLLGPGTALRLINRLKLTKEEVIGALTRCHVPPRGDYFEGLEATTQNAIVDASRFLGWSDYTGSFKSFAGEAFAKYREEKGVYPDMIGPKFIQWLIEKVREAK